MDDTDKVIQLIRIVLNGANFLLNTRRVIKAIELFKECLVLLNSEALEVVKELSMPIVIHVYDNLFHAYTLVNDHASAIECGKKSLTISKDIACKKGEAAAYAELGAVFQAVGQKTRAEEYLQKSITISKEIGDKGTEAAAYGILGVVFRSVSQYTKAEEYLRKALTIREEIGDKEGEALNYGNLGAVFQSVGQYTKAEEYLQKALTVSKEIGAKGIEAAAYGNLGAVFQAVGQNTRAEEYLQKSITISKEIGDKGNEAAAYGILGVVYRSVSQYTKAEEYLRKALTIREETGDKEGEALDFGNLGAVFQSVGQYTKAEEYLQKALTISKEIGAKGKEALAYGNLGVVFQSVGQYTKAEKYLQKALTISKEICDKETEASVCVNLGLVFRCVGQYTKAEEYHQNALTISEEIGDRRGVGSTCMLLGQVWRAFNLHAKAQEFDKQALEISYEIGDIELQFSSHLMLTLDTLALGESIDNAVRNLLVSIQKCEEMHVFLREKHQFKISFFDEHVSPYHLLSLLFISTRNHYEALYVAELGRARSLADTLSAQYSLEKEISANPQSWVRIENIMDKNSLSTSLYLFCYHYEVYFWVLKPNKTIVFREKQLKKRVDEVFGNQTFGSSRLLTEELCEDRSLFSSYVGSLTTCKRTQHESSAALRPIEEENDENQDPEPPTLTEVYNMIIDPVVDLLQEPEIIIFPDRPLHRIPFAALKNDDGKYLSDTFRIRFVPSLTTLKLIQHSPADYHSNTGALIVGEPAVREVYHKGILHKLCPLPWARKEAEMIGQLLGVQPLLGKNATKQAVLKSMHSVSLIHFAAHGNAERGEIALSPSSSCRTPHEGEYLLTMTEISQVRLTAKLVVLSCCHSARGQIRAEGVVGIARAFVASGARAVLVALWAIEDKATMRFMNRFYEHLIRGESASESLHQAMKWMRKNGFSDVEQWAPFLLIGDNVTFNFGK